MEYIRPLLFFSIFVVSAALLLIVLRYKVRVPDYVFRKLMHTVAFTSSIPLVLLTDEWWVSVLSTVIAAIAAAVLILIFEKTAFYKKVVVEKKQREVLLDLLLFFALLAVLTVIFFGIAGIRYRFIIIAAIFCWGPGDAAAALVGIKFGNHKLSGKHIDGEKSVEGSIAMITVSFISTLCVLLIMSGMGVFPCVLISLLCAGAAAAAELFTTRGLDNTVIPAVSAVILCLSFIFAR